MIDRQIKIDGIEHQAEITHQQAMPTIYIGRLKSSPIGPMWVAVSALGLVAIDWDMPQADFTRQVQGRLNANVVYDEIHTNQAIQQLSEYLAGERRRFTLPIDFSDMTRFQMQVLNLTLNIPYGETSTYKELANRLGNQLAARAVGRVEATNPIPLVIPCHRVLGSDGNLHGYGGPGGIKLKAWLLELENTHK
ncbi:MAG TPA: methylated-DNA--[protein]-cysteine S-methyltransferase [Anaerolineales bacterium]